MGVIAVGLEVRTVVVVVVEVKTVVVVLVEEVVDIQGLEEYRLVAQVILAVEGQAEVTGGHHRVVVLDYHLGTAQGEGEGGGKREEGGGEGGEE